MRVPFAILLSCCLISPALAESASSLAALNNLSFFYGREYFVLRSGRAQMVIQADKADLGPALIWLLFDAQNAAQSARKEKAFNYSNEKGFSDSALEVQLGGCVFTALGHRTQTRWTITDGIPTVEATWWAGGVRVTEQISALADGVFHRAIRLRGDHLPGADRVNLLLALPAGDRKQMGRALLQNGRGAKLALAASQDIPVQIHPEQGIFELGPLPVASGRETVCDVFLLVQIDQGDEKTFEKCVTTLERSAAASEKAKAQAQWAVSSSIRTKDGLVRNIFDKARFGLPGMVAEDGAIDAGIFEYGAQWVRDSSNTALGLLHAGHFELARHVLDRILTRMITKEGVTMIAGGFDAPDREQFDQMGELIHLLKAYRDWTGDDSLARQNRELLRALIERPLQPQFRDETGMVHNRREFWERTFDDGYELAYQTYVILGLRDAADLAPALGAQDQAARWRAEADRIEQTMLKNPTRALVDQGHLIKRRNRSGEVADQIDSSHGFLADAPASTEAEKRLMPDASQALPIALGIVPGRSELARRTLNELERLWNTRWDDGGYDRYHTSSQPDQPGPWSFATCFILRAQHEAGLWQRSRRSLEWLDTVQGGRAGAWFEEIPSIRSGEQSCGLLPWTSAEIALFATQHYLGLRFAGDSLVIRPALYPGSPPVSADLRFRNQRLHLEIDGSGPIRRAIVNGTKLKPTQDGSLRLPATFDGGQITIKTKS